MKTAFNLLAILYVSIVLNPANSQDSVPKPVELLFETFRQTRQIKSMSYTMTKEERIDGDMIRQVSFSKLNRSPLKVYLRQEYPKEGLEVLYTGEGKALINPNGFPWFNLRLSPTGSIMRENQHHTILESGYDHVINILEYLLVKYDSISHSMLVLTGESLWDDQPVWKIELNNPNYQINEYIMQPNETVKDVARRQMLSEYWIVERNKGINDPDDKAPGTLIKIPNDYSPKMELLIDKKRMIPLVMKIYDDRGLFEHYSYTDVVLNPTFLTEEFERGYEGYGF